MNPKIEKLAEENGVLSFELSNVNVSFANAIRRVMLSEIDSVVFRTFPHKENKANFIKNTTRFTNEILKQRLSCVPIHLPTDAPIKDLSIEVNVKNNTDEIVFVTTKDFKIKQKTSGTILSESQQHKIFPANPISKDYILFAKLRPGIGGNGEELHFTADFDIGNGKENGMFSAASISTFSNTLDPIKIASAWKEEERKITTENEMSKQDLELYRLNWMLLNGQRHFKDNSFDFKVESVGVYSNEALIIKACDVMIGKINDLYKKCDTQTLKIKKSATTIENSYDITLENESYSLGKAIEFILYTNFYINEKVLSYCGFKKFHPHDDDSVIRIAFIKNEEMVTILEYLKTSCSIATNTFEKIKTTFSDHP